MLQSINTLQGSALYGTDGEIGTIYECYFGDDAWTVRYLVVDTGTWLAGRRVLISPFAVRSIESESRALRVNLTRTQVEHSPDIATELPISRQQELAYLTYYSWPKYWGMDPASAGAYSEATEYLGSEKGLQPQEETTEDSHLRRTREVIGYTIRATDGEIGHVEDFLVDDQTWLIRSMVVDTQNWWPGKKVVVAPRWIREIRWIDSTVHLSLLREQIKNQPEFDLSRL